MATFCFVGWRFCEVRKKYRNRNSWNLLENVLYVSCANHAGIHAWISPGNTDSHFLKKLPNMYTSLFWYTKYSHLYDLHYKMPTKLLSDEVLIQRIRLSDFRADLHAAVYAPFHVSVVNQSSYRYDRSLRDVHSVRGTSALLYQKLATICTLHFPPSPWRDKVGCCSPFSLCCLCCFHLISR